MAMVQLVGFGQPNRGRPRLGGDTLVLGVLEADVDEAAVRSAIDHLRHIVEGDGANLHLARLDHQTDTVELDLDVADANCAECLLPHEVLLGVMTSHIHDVAGPGIHVMLRDPRQDSPASSARPTSARHD
jgi:hypothetical protein